VQDSGLRKPIGFWQRIDGALLAGLVGDNVDVVLFGLLLLRWHVR
jgi:hypothetical protein